MQPRCVRRVAVERAAFNTFIAEDFMLLADNNLIFKGLTSHFLSLYLFLYNCRVYF